MNARTSLGNNPKPMEHQAVPVIDAVDQRRQFLAPAGVGVAALLQGRPAYTRLMSLERLSGSCAPGNAVYAARPRSTWNSGRAIEFRVGKHGGRLARRSRWRPIVKREGRFFAVKIDLDHAIDRFADDDELVERGLEQASLHITADDRDQDNEAGMERLLCIKLPKSLALLVTRTKSPSRA